MTFPNSSHARGFFPPQQLLLLQHFWLISVEVCPPPMHPRVTTMTVFWWQLLAAASMINRLDHVPFKLKVHDLTWDKGEVVLSEVAVKFISHQSFFRMLPSKRDSILDSPSIKTHYTSKRLWTPNYNSSTLLEKLSSRERFGEQLWGFAHLQQLILLTFERGKTKKAPPPLDSTITARNFGLTAQNELSHVTLETRMSS